MPCWYKEKMRFGEKNTLTQQALELNLEYQERSTVPFISISRDNSQRPLKIVIKKWDSNWHLGGVSNYETIVFFVTWYY